MVTVFDRPETRPRIDLPARADGFRLLLLDEDDVSVDSVDSVLRLDDVFLLH